MKLEDATHLADFFSTTTVITTVHIVICRHCGKTGVVANENLVRRGMGWATQLPCCKRSNVDHEGP